MIRMAHVATASGPSCPHRHRLDREAYSGSVGSADPALPDSADPASCESQIRFPQTRQSGWLVPRCSPCTKASKQTRRRTHSYSASTRFGRRTVERSDGGGASNWTTRVGFGVASQETRVKRAHAAWRPHRSLTNPGRAGLGWSGSAIVLAPEMVLWAVRSGWWDSEQYG